MGDGTGAGPVVALATCAAFPDLEAPERLVIEPLARRGISAVPAVWDDPSVGWGRFDLVVLRGTWDYAERREEFLQWVHATDRVTPVLNPPATVAWNTDKRYLGELAAAGIPVVPTAYLQTPAGGLPTSGEYVVKPTVSAGSRDTARYRAGVDDDVARRHVERVLAEGREVMVQPYLRSVDEAGETGMLHLDGRFSHAIRKGPLLRLGQPPTDALFAAEEITPRTPSAAEHAVAAAVMRWLEGRFGRLLYTRVDLLATPGGPVVLEVEATEPSLFIETGDALPDRFAAAIAARLSG